MRSVSTCNMSQINGRANGFHIGEGVVAGRRAAAPRAVVIVVATRDDPDYPLEALLEPLVRGATAYTFNAASSNEAVMAVQRVLSAWPPLEPSLPASALWQQAVQPPARAQRPAAEVELTVRERDVLRLLAAGKTNPQIACELMLSVGTVKGHVQHILGKLGVADRTQAAVRALQLGLLAPG